jgi:hemoglobin
MLALYRIAARSALTAAVVAGLVLPRTLHAQESTRSLFDRLGGVYPIAVVVDEFINRLMANDVLNANPAIATARQRVPAPGLKYHVTAMVCQATGGSCGYTGRTMKLAHAHLNINDREWQEMVQVFRQVLAQFKVPAREQQELVAIVESTKADIVTRK